MVQRSEQARRHSRAAGVLRAAGLLLTALEVDPDRLREAVAAELGRVRR